MTAAFPPVRLVHADLSEGPPTLPAEDGWVQIVFWWGDVPLGEERLLGSQVAARARYLAAVAADTVAPAVAQRVGDTQGLALEPASLSRTLSTVRGPGDGAAADAADVSVVVCTRERAGALEGCLQALRRLTPRPLEIIVVDNAPPTARAVVGAHDGVRYVAEPRPGLSAARNAGVAAARGSIVAFTDDDATPHPRWVGRVAAAFDEPSVMAVTGLVLPAELETPTQVAFEDALGGFGRGYLRRTFDRRFFESNRRRGVPVWNLGAGANMAVRREAFDQVGGFEELLGAGAAGCSEDTELWYRLLAAGWRCRYEPAAVVFHTHRRDRQGLRRQAHLYARGHAVALFVQFARHRHWGNVRRVTLSIPRYFAARTLHEVLLGVRRRPGTLLAEFTGYVAAFAYLPAALTAGRHQPPRPASAWTPSGASPRGLPSAPDAAPPSAPRVPRVPHRSSSARPAATRAARSAWRRGRTRHKARRGPFLRANPFPNPRSEGIFFREKMRAIHHIAPDDAVRDVLEVGGGQSALSSLLYPRAKVVNIDLEPQYAGAPPNQSDRIRFVTGDATRLPFPDAAFDAVTLFDVLEHIPDDAAAAAEAWRVLRPGGVLMVTSPNDGWRFPYHRALAPVCPTDAEVMADWGHVRRGYRLERLEQLVGRPADATATFITPLTAIGHDLAFSRLPGRLRRLVCTAVSPLTWWGYVRHRPHRPGTETAVSWRKPLAAQLPEDTGDDGSGRRSSAA